MTENGDPDAPALSVLGGRAHSPSEAILPRANRLLVHTHAAACGDVAEEDGVVVRPSVRPPAARPRRERPPSFRAGERASERATSSQPPPVRPTTTAMTDRRRTCPSGMSTIVSAFASIACAASLMRPVASRIELRV